LTPRDLAAIVAVANLQPLKPRAVLLRQGRPATSFYVIMRGRLKVGQVTPGGHESAVRMLGPGHMVGGPALFGNATYPVTASAMEPSVVLSWSAAAISSLVSRYPQLARNVMLAMAKRIVELQDRCRELATENVHRRLARALLRLAGHTPQKPDAGPLTPIRCSRQDLSEIAGTTLFTVSRILSQWNRQGLVKTARQKVLLLRPLDLHRIADPADPD
jgi:CRP-like cAMP-binding protein